MVTCWMPWFPPHDICCIHDIWGYGHHGMCCDPIPIIWYVVIWAHIPGSMDRGSYWLSPLTGSSSPLHPLITGYTGYGTMVYAMLPPHDIPCIRGCGYMDTWPPGPMIPWPHHYIITLDAIIPRSQDPRIPWYEVMWWYAVIWYVMRGYIVWYGSMGTMV